MRVNDNTVRADEDLYEVQADRLDKSLAKDADHTDDSAAARASKKFSVKDLNLHYGTFHALKNVSIDIDTNAITALIGPSGCGKSTFLKTLNRMNDFEEGIKIEGSVQLDGQEIYGKDMNPIELRQRVGMVFQQPNPFPKTIYDNVAYGPRIRGIHKAVAPEVILMDEPTSALDPISTMKIEDLAMELKKKYTIVIVTHNMQQANRISDKTAFFLLGELIEYGKTSDIFLNPKNKKTEEYITGRFG